MWYTVGWASIKEITASFMVEKGVGAQVGFSAQQSGECVISNALYFAREL